MGEIVSSEAAKSQGEERPSDEEVFWEAVKDRAVFEDGMRRLVGEVDRMHVLYVYSRFLNSRAVGPPLVKEVLEGES